MNYSQANNSKTVNSPYLIQRTNEAVKNYSTSEKISGTVNQYHSDTIKNTEKNSEG